MRSFIPLRVAARRPSAAIVAILVVAAGCAREAQPDAYGNFEATETVVSAQTAGQIQRFVPVEGARLETGTVVALIDTTPLALEREQLAAQRAAVAARGTEAGEQLEVLRVQREIAHRAWARTKRLHDAQAATAQQLDQAERDYRVAAAQIDALEAQRRSISMDASSSEARVAQVRDRIARSSVVSPVAGTVLVTYARVGEVVQAGQPLFKLANLDTLELRVYVTEPQLAAVRLGQPVAVHVDQGADARRTLRGTVAWVSAKAEFTPTPVQTRDERADLVYAVKVRVPNPDGALKIGMPADITLAAAARAVAARP